MDYPSGATAPRTGPVRVRWHAVFLAVAVVAGIALRLAPMQTPLWLDELFTAWAADPKMSLGELYPRIVRDPQPLGYYPLMWLWHQLAGTGDAASRLLGGLGGAAALPLTALLLRGVVPGATVALAVGLLALGWSGVYFAHEARAYALLYAASAVGYALVLRNLAHGTPRRRQLALAGVGLAAGLVHYFGMLLGCALWFAQATGHWRRGQRRMAQHDLYRMLAMAALFVVLLGPQLKHLDHLTGGAFWISNDAGKFVRDYARMLAPNALAQIGWLGLWVLAAAGLWRTRSATLPLWAGLGISFAVPALISLHTPLLLPRYLIMTVPPLVLALTLAACARPVAWRHALAVLLVCLIGLSSMRAYSRVRKEDWPGAATLVTQTLAQEGCPIPVYRWKSALYQHYLPPGLRERVVRVESGDSLPALPAGCRLVLWYGYGAPSGQALPVAAPVAVRAISLHRQTLWVADPPPAAGP